MEIYGVKIKKIGKNSKYTDVPKKKDPELNFMKHLKTQCLRSNFHLKLRFVKLFCLKIRN